MKWLLFLAGISDMRRPVEAVSVNQNVALAATGIIWSRYATQIQPINYSLLAVNACVAAGALFQLGRVTLHHRDRRMATPLIDDGIEEQKRTTV
jgi:hypothetical protein